MNELDVLKRNAGINEAEKRWKQTSMSPEEAIEKYGKENVKVKKGALRNGDDMVEVFVESKNINEDSKMIKVKVINSGYRTDMGMKDAEIISQELDFRGMPILKVRIEDVNMGDPVVADFKNGGWVVDMD